jgi:hypothetical protein
MTAIDHGALEAIRTIKQARSPRWPSVERAHLAKNPHCACCESGKYVDAGQQVHHKFPFHYCIALGRPDLELDERNLITLCEDEAGRPGQNHHLLIGHLDNFKSSNLTVVVDATHTFHGMNAAMIRASSVWKAKVDKRLKSLDLMSAEDKKEFTALMNKTFPK